MDEKSSKSINQMSKKELKNYLVKRKLEIQNQLSEDRERIKNLELEKEKNEKNIDLLKNSNDIEFIVKIGKKYGLNLNDNTMFLRLNKVILKDRIIETNNKIDDQITELKKNIAFSKSDLNSIDKCPVCGGMGQEIDVEYVRQSGRVTPIRHVIKCKFCNGTGKISGIK